MKKTAIAIAVALAGFATVAQAAPKDNTWYTGAKLGVHALQAPLDFSSNFLPQWGQWTSDQPRKGKLAPQ